MKVRKRSQENIHPGKVNIQGKKNMLSEKSNIEAENTPWILDTE